LRKGIAKALAAGSIVPKTLLASLQKAVTSLDAAVPIAPETAACVRSCAWLVICEVITAQATRGTKPPKANGEFLLKSWSDAHRQMAATGSLVGDDAARILKVLGIVATQLTEAERTRIAHDVATCLRTMAAAPSQISTCVTTLARCTEADHPDNALDAANAAATWIKPIMTACEDVLREFALSESADFDTAAVDNVCKALFTVGEMASMGLDDTRAGTTDNTDRPKGRQTGVSKVQIKAVVPSVVVTFVHALVSKSLAVNRTSLSAIGRTIDGTVNLSGSLDEATEDGVSMSMTGSVPIPSVIRAHAFLALGKLCLRDGALAKRVVHMLVRELRDTTSDVSVRSNVLLVLCDLCVRYTAIGKGNRP
jgi:hypothetical protein